MSADPNRAGLSRAQRAIAETYEDLCFTLESVRKLTDAGSPNAALRLVDAQRDALDALVSRLASDVAVLPVRRRLIPRARALIAAVLAVVTVAAGVVVARDEATKDLDRALAQAEHISDPRVQLVAFNALYRDSLARPQAAGEGFRSKLIKALDDFRHEKRNQDNGLAPEAGDLVTAVRASEGESVPDPPYDGPGVAKIIEELLEQ